MSPPEDTPSTEVLNSGFAERMKMLVARTTSGSVLAFSRLAEISEPMARRYLGRKAEPGLTALTRIANAGGTTVGWLASGEGPMLPKAGSDTPWDQTTVMVPLFEAELSAGVGRSPWSEEHPVEMLRLPRSVVCQDWGVHGNPVALRVVGNSMESTIQNGAIVVLDTTVSRITRDGLVYAIRVDDSLLIKRAYLVPNQGLRLAGDNKATPELVLTAQEADALEVLGRVRGVISNV